MTITLQDIEDLRDKLLGEVNLRINVFRTECLLEDKLEPAKEEIELRTNHDKRLDQLASFYMREKERIEKESSIKHKTVWDLEDDDDSYNLHGDGEAMEYRNGSTRNIYRDNGNLFLTEEEAEKESERRRAETKVIKRIAELNDGWKIRWDGKQYKYNINYNCGADILVVYDTMDTIKVRKCFYLKSRHAAEQLIKEMPNELKTMLGVESD